MRTKKTYSIVEISYETVGDAAPTIKSVNVEENVTAEELPELLAANDGIKRVVFAGSEIPWEVKQTVQLGEKRTRKPRTPKPEAAEKPKRARKAANGAATNEEVQS